MAYSKAAVVVGSAITGLMLLIAYTTSKDTKVNLSIKQRELEEAVFYLEGSLSGLGEAGYQQWTPTTAASEVVAVMNAATQLTPEEKAEFQQRGMRPPKVSVSYALDAPTQPWQVVLIPDDEHQMIHLAAYSTDLHTPVLQKDLPCCQF